MAMNAIIWPEGFIPGEADNFASNEVIVKGLGVVDVWPFLNIPSRWPTYYPNSADIRFHDGKGPELAPDLRFFFRTFGFPVEAQVVEHVPPPPASLRASRGTAGPAMTPRPGSTCITPGFSRICPATTCAS